MKKLLNDPWDVIELLDNKSNIYVENANGYGEPGYTVEEGKKGILLGDWNEFDKYPNIMGFIEEHFEIEWSDEWVVDRDNSKAYRCSPDCYSWQPAHIIHETGEVLGVDTINDMNDDEVKELLDELDYINNPKTAINLNGFKPRGEDITKSVLGRDHGESGWHPGQDDSPDTMLLKAQEIDNPTGSYYFVVDYTRQFDIGFSIYKF